MAADESETPLTVACLCAAWCGTCRDYRPVFDALEQRFGARIELRWIDIEDEAELLGELDVEDFPTLLIGRAGTPLFFGALLPHAATLQRLVETALAGDLKPAPHAAAAALLARLAG